MAKEQAEQVVEYRVPEGNLPWLDKKFEKMRKIAVQVGAEPPTYKILREVFEKRMIQAALSAAWVWDEGKYNKIYIITVSGEAPKVAGWTFVATLTHTKDGNLLNKVPGEIADLPKKYRSASPFCDYCGLSRRRTDSFIVRNDKGDYQQVGRNCLAKFLGYSNPGRIADYATWFSNIGGELAEQEEKLFSGGGKASEYGDLESFLTMVVAVTEEKGWVSKAQAMADERLTPSIMEVNFQLSPEVREPRNRHLRIRPTDEHKKKAIAAIAFARSDKLTTDTDYKHNLKISTATNMFHWKASAIVASLINFRDRSKEQELLMYQRRVEAEKRRAEFKKSEHIGVVGERITVPVRIIRRRVLDSQFGVTYLFRMVDADNDIFVWFASNDVLEEGKWYNITGTVKKHDTYDGIKQTVLTRCKVGEIESVVEDTTSVGFDVGRQSAQRTTRTRKRKTKSRAREVGPVMGAVGK